MQALNFSASVPLPHPDYFPSVVKPVSLPSLLSSSCPCSLPLNVLLWSWSSLCHPHRPCSHEALCPKAEVSPCSPALSGTLPAPSATYWYVTGGCLLPQCHFPIVQDTAPSAATYREGSWT